MIYRKDIPSPVGTLTLASDGEKLVGLWMEGQKHFPEIPMEEIANLSVFRQTELWLTRYFEGQEPDPAELPLAPAGSQFQQEVWKLLQIPYGRVTTYGQIAKEIGCKSAQAVGGAVGRNPISIIIPCHRVIASNGKLTRYAGGLERKQYLLELERAPVK